MRGAKVDIHRVLRVFQTVQEKGKFIGEEKFLDGIFVSSGFDGYSVSLRDDKTTLTLGFHNTLNFHSKNAEAEALFLKRLSAIDTSDYK